MIRVDEYKWIWFWELFRGVLRCFMSSCYVLVWSSSAAAFNAQLGVTFTFRFRLYWWFRLISCKRNAYNWAPNATPIIEHLYLYPTQIQICSSLIITYSQSMNQNQWIKIEWHIEIWAIWSNSSDLLTMLMHKNLATVNPDRVQIEVVSIVCIALVTISIRSPLINLEILFFENSGGAPLIKLLKPTRVRNTLYIRSSL